MNPAAPLFATTTRVAGVVLVFGYLSGLVPGAVVSIVGGLALITFGRGLLLDRHGTAIAASALAIAAGALGVAALRWSTLSLEELVGVQSVLGPTVFVGPQNAALATTVALGAAILSVAVWSTEPLVDERRGRIWSRVEGVLAIAAAVVVFAAPAVGGSVSNLFSDPIELAPPLAALSIGGAAVFFAPRVLKSTRVRWVILAVCGLVVVAAAALVALEL